LPSCVLLRSVSPGLNEIELFRRVQFGGTGVPGLQPGYATMRISSFEDINRVATQVGLSRIGSCGLDGSGYDAYSYQA
jgi:hypothetical protein